MYLFEVINTFFACIGIWCLWIAFQVRFNNRFDLIRSSKLVALPRSETIAEPYSRHYSWSGGLLIGISATGLIARFSGASEVVLPLLASLVCAFVAMLSGAALTAVIGRLENETAEATNANTNQLSSAPLPEDRAIQVKRASLKQFILLSITTVISLISAALFLFGMFTGKVVPLRGMNQGLIALSENATVFCIDLIAWGLVAMTMAVPVVLFVRGSR